MTPTTKLEAVNIMLSSIGESPVNSLNSGLVDAEIAETILNGINREVQGKGWHFNTEIKMRLSPSLNNEIVLPPNTLRVDRAVYDKDQDLIQRGGKLYNKSTHSFTITAAVELDMVVLLDFEDIPEAARRYITIRAARIFQDRVVGDQELHAFQQTDEMQAWVELQDEEAQTADYSVFDNYDVARVLHRGIATRLG
jgi:hypothetical protein